MIVGITGKIGSGKSTCANHLVKKGYTEYSMSTPLKEIGKIFGFSDRQLYGTQEQKLQIHPHWGISSRTFLQKTGTELFRDAMPKIIPDMKIERTIWVDLFKLKYKKEPKLYVISDIRFLDEAAMIKELDGIIIRTIRDNKVSSESKVEHNHRSEMEMDQIEADYVIDNSLDMEESFQTLDILLNIEKVSSLV